MRLAVALAGLVALLLASIHHPLVHAAFATPWAIRPFHAGTLVRLTVKSLALHLLAGMVLAGWWGGGRRVRGWLGARRGSVWFELTAGLVAASAAVHGLGLTGLLSPLPLAATAAAAAVCTVPWRRWRYAFVAGAGFAPADAWPGLALLPVLPWLIAAPLLPPMNVDMLEYHLGVPVLWLAAHKMYLQPANLLFTMPLGGERLAVPFLAWGADGAAVALHTLVLAAAGLALTAALRRAGSVAAAAGGWVLFGCGAALALAVDGHPDTLLLLAAAAGCLFLTGEGTARDLGLVAALACAAKYQGALLAAALGAAAWSRRGMVRRTLNAGVVCALASLPWLLFNALTTGNPCYPFLSRLYPSLGWADWNTDALWRSMGNASVVIERGFPEDTLRQFLAAFWNGIGTVWVSPLAVLLYLAPLLLLAPGEPVRRRLALAATLFAAAWLWPIPKFGRYLLPGLVPALAAWWLLWPRGARRLAAGGAAVVVGLGAASFLGFFRVRPVPPEAVLTGAATSDAYMAAAQGGYWSAVRWMNAHAARGERALVIGQGNGWGLPRPWLANNETGRPAWYAAAGPAADAGRMRVAFRQAGVRWVVYDPVRATSRHGYALDLPLSDDWMRAYADLWRRWIDVAREPDLYDATGEWYLYRVRDQPRPPRPHGWLPGLERLLPDEMAVRRGQPVPRLELQRRIIPDFGVTWFHRALDVWAVRHDARAAERACREALERGFVLPAVYDTLGAFLYEQRRYAEAAAAMRRALALDPGNVAAKANLAETLLHLPRGR